MKRVLGWMLALLLLLGCVAEEVALVGADTEKMLAMMGVQPNADGSYAVMSNEAAAYEAYFYDRIANYAGTGLLYMYLSAEGNAQTGIGYACLNILYAANAAINTEYVSLAVNGARYDLKVAREVKNSGRYKVEVLKVFVDEDVRALIEQLNGAAKADICLFGSEKYAQSLEVRANYNGNAKNELGGASLSALKLPACAQEACANGLSDLALATYEAEYGVKHSLTKTELNAECLIALDAAFGLVGVQANGNAIRQTQELLKAQGFLAGTATTTVTPLMAQAVRRAQRYYGLPEIGYADSALIALLSAGEAPEYRAPKKESTVYQNVADNISVNIDRCFYAKAAATLNGKGRVGVSDADNVLIVFDGSILSTAVKTVSLAWEVTSEVSYNGRYLFPATMYAEAQGGNAFATSLGMLAESRLVIVCEIPQRLVDEEGEWALTIHAGAQDFTFYIAK